MSYLIIPTCNKESNSSLNIFPSVIALEITQSLKRTLLLGNILISVYQNINYILTYVYITINYDYITVWYFNIDIFYIIILFFMNFKDLVYPDSLHICALGWALQWLLSSLCLLSLQISLLLSLCWNKINLMAGNSLRVRKCTCNKSSSSWSQKSLIHKVMFI